MCGINGFNFENKETIAAMNRAVAHRGPDGDGMFVGGGVSLGHTRLAIIDLTEKGAQPMRYKHLTITYGGEVYNYLELREELQRNGHTFKTESDTEVILAAFDEWGSECVHKFNGMWAMCIYNSQTNELFLSRDRFGVKPLYYYFENRVFVFASEIKSILEHKKLGINKKENINPTALELYFSMGYIPAPHSIYNTVQKLSAAHSLIFDIEKKEIKKIWNYYTLPKFSPLDDRQRLLDEGRELLDSATQLRMRSDVPVGAFLSGGLDSSAVTATMAKYAKDETPLTFSVEFSDPDHNEEKFIRTASRYIDTDHESVSFDEVDFNKKLEEYIHHFDEPFGDYAGFPTLTVSELASQEVIVALSGDGGDEVFGGYKKYVMGAQIMVLYSVPQILRKMVRAALLPFEWISKIAMLRRAIELSFLSKEEFYANATETFGYSSVVHKDFVRKHMGESLTLCDGNLAEAMRVYDTVVGTLPDSFLTKVDRASMAHGLEVRSPFMDYRFMEYSQKIPTKWKQNSLGQTKIIMREIIKDILPESIVNRGKSGFTPPLTWVYSEANKSEIENGMIIIKELCPSAYEWYENNKQVSKDRTRERIRTDRIMWLYLFSVWHKEWIT